MSEQIPLPQRILNVAEELLRRHGVEKTNVVDIARAMGMSHANIYRHFPSKRALLDAVALRWLHALTDPLKLIVQDHSRPASERLVAWFNALRAAKQRTLCHDVELLRVHFYLVESAREVVEEHVEVLLGQIEQILIDGITAGEFSRNVSPEAGARAFLHATSPFHHPAMVLQKSPPTEADAQAVLHLLLAGLRAG